MQNSRQDPELTEGLWFWEGKWLGGFARQGNSDVLSCFTFPKSLLSTPMFSEVQ